MVYVPGGRTIVGVNALYYESGQQVQDSYYDRKTDRNLDNYRSDYSFPRRSVTLPGFWMYKYEVTLGQFKAYLHGTEQEQSLAKMIDGLKYSRYTDQHPCYYVWWEEADKYAKWANASLPTELQWEKAARGTDERLYPWGNTWDAKKCSNEYIYKKLQTDTAPVGSFPDDCSPYGCMDMAGNVWEWCWGQYEKDDDVPALMRGGCVGIHDSPTFTTVHRADGRHVFNKDMRGFRCVVNLPE